MRKIYLLLLAAICCHVRSQAQLVIGPLVGYGLPVVYDNGTKAPGDPKNASTDPNLVLGGSVMIGVGKSIAIGVTGYTQTYAFTTHSSQTASGAYAASDIIHNSNFLFIAPTFSLIFDPLDHIQLNLCPAYGINTGGTESLKQYAETANGATSGIEITNTNKNISQSVYSAGAQLQENIPLGQHFQLTFIESYSYMFSNITTTTTTMKALNPGYASVQVAIFYKTHKKSVKYFEARFK